MLGEYAEESLDRPEQRAVDHDRLLTGAVRGLVLQLEPLGQVEVHLDRRHLPGAADGVAGLHRDLRAVVRRATGVGDELQPGVVRSLLQRRGRLLPVLSGADELVRVVAGRELEVEVAEPIVGKQVEHEAEEVLELVGHLLLRTEDVRVVHRQAANPGEPVHDTGLLVAVDGAELEQPQR